MAGRKRAATDDSPKRETRSSKVRKTDGGARGATGRGAKGTARLKTGLTTTAFKARAAPLHVAISYEPFPGEGEAAAAATAAAGEAGAAELPHFLATTTLAPSSFTTGSFGWKGSKRVVVALRSAKAAHGESEGDGEGGEDTLHVMLTINATVIGSKEAKEAEAEEEGEGAKEGAPEGEGAHEETAEVSAEAKEAAEVPAETT